jgi:hypothetical protein
MLMKNLLVKFRFCENLQSNLTTWIAEAFHPHINSVGLWRQAYPDHQLEVQANTVSSVRSRRWSSAWPNSWTTSLDLRRSTVGRMCRQTPWYGSKFNGTPFNGLWGRFNWFSAFRDVCESRKGGKGWTSFLGRCEYQQFDTRSAPACEFYSIFEGSRSDSIGRRKGANSTATQSIINNDEEW